MNPRGRVNLIQAATCVRLWPMSQLADERLMRIRLFARTAPGKPSVEATMEQAWSSYVDQYVRPDLTAPDLQPKQPVFLQRCERGRGAASDWPTVGSS